MCTTTSLTLLRTSSRASTPLSAPASSSPFPECPPFSASPSPARRHLLPREAQCRDVEGSPRIRRSTPPPLQIEVFRHPRRARLLRLLRRTICRGSRASPPRGPRSATTDAASLRRRRRRRPPSRALQQSHATCPAATSTTSPGPQRRAVGTARGPLNPLQQAAAAKSPSSVAALKTTPPSLQVQSTPPPARARTPSPSRGSRSSSLSSSGPSHMSWDSTGSSVMPYSYAEVVKGRANHSPDANLVQRLLDYLIK